MASTVKVDFFVSNYLCYHYYQVVSHIQIIFLKIVPHTVYDYILFSDMKMPMDFTESPPILCRRSSVMWCQ